MKHQESRLAFLAFVTVFATACLPAAVAQESNTRPSSRNQPNFVFAIADDWGWPHASAYGDAAVKTPAFDRVAKNGVLFNRAFVSSPSCTPSRGSIITGQHFWRLGGAANLWAEWPANTYAEYPALLQEAGYFTGHYRKAWGPGKFENQPAGNKFDSIAEFFETRNDGQPFCFWFGTSDPHREYEPGSGSAAGIPLDRVHMFRHFPDTAAVRNDVADYYFEVQRFDREFGDLINRLEETGELDNTIVVVTGDHGMPFPRCKGHLYDSGTRVPLAIQGPGIPGGRLVADFVSMTDIAPTFLEAAGIDIPEQMTGKSLLTILHSTRSGQIEAERDHVLFGRERHTVSQEKGIRGGYPMRSIRTADFLYIRNFYPDRWPAGTPNYENAEFKRAWLSDCDNGPTKKEIWDQRETDSGRKLYELSFGKRPAEELYDLTSDPDQLINVASQKQYEATKGRLARQLSRELIDSLDPRLTGADPAMDEYGKYLGGGGGQWTNGR